MKRLILFAAAVIVTLGAATTLRSHPQQPAMAATGMPALADLHRAPAARALTREDYDDMTMIYTNAMQAP